MSVFGRDVPYQRLGGRASVNGPALIVREGRKRFGRATESLVPVLVSDASVSGALLAIPGDVQPNLGQVLVLVIDGLRGSVRVRRVAAIRPDEITVGVEFVDPSPEFLPTIYQWIGREAGLGSPRMV
jgi:hypothetical protein